MIKYQHYLDRDAVLSREEWINLYSEEDLEKIHIKTKKEASVGMGDSIKFEDLKAVFAPEDIEWRVQTAGKRQDGTIWAQVLAYVTNRAIMERLDAVCGAENWKNEFTSAPDGGVLCGLSIRVGDEWVTKWDGAENTDIEAVKGGLSSAMKRAGVQWGIGRYLYNLTATFVNADPKGTERGNLPKNKGGDFFKWNKPDLPEWALPVGYKPKKEKKADPQDTEQQPDPDVKAEAEKLVKELNLDQKQRAELWGKSGQNWDKLLEALRQKRKNEIHKQV